MMPGIVSSEGTRCLHLQDRNNIKYVHLLVSPYPCGKQLMALSQTHPVLCRSDGVSEARHAHSGSQHVYRAVLLCGLHRGSVGGAGGPRVAPLPAVPLGAHAAGSLLLLAAPRERSLAHPQRQGTRGRSLLPEDLCLQRERGTALCRRGSIQGNLSAALQTENGEKRDNVHRLYESRHVIS